MRPHRGEVVGGGGSVVRQQARLPAESEPRLGYDVDAPGSRGAAGFLLDALRHRHGGRIVMSTVTAVLFVGGLGMFTYPFFTDLYTEQVVQGRLTEEFANDVAMLGASGETDDPQAASEGQSDAWRASLRSGDPLTRMSIPALDVETIVVSGTSPAALRAGAGHFPTTPLPGERGNVAVAGHRTTYGKPFNRIDELRAGDPIWLETPLGDYEYVVVDPPSGVGCQPYAQRGAPGAGDSAACLTDPKGWPMIAEVDGAVLTLMACHPKGSAAERIWIRAELVGSHDRGTWRSRSHALSPGPRP